LRDFFTNNPSFMEGTEKVSLIKIVCRKLAGR